jgi:hypothetical protein
VSRLQAASRDPRRAYDEDGLEFTSATLRANDVKGILACYACKHEALLPFERLD